MVRQQLLARPPGAQVLAVRDGAAPRRPVSDPQLMRAQFHHLTGLTALPNITLQVVPLRLGGPTVGVGVHHPGFSERDLPDIVYLDQGAK